MEESSSKNAAIVLKMIGASQGNVWPVDISHGNHILFIFYNYLRLHAATETRGVSERVGAVY
jgi:hypothetical protein